MSIWKRLIGLKNAKDTNQTIGDETIFASYDVLHYAIVDAEIGLEDKKVHDIGALRYDGAVYHKASEKAVRIIKSLISRKYIAKAQDSEAESRIDYLADILGMSKIEVISVVERMRQEGILADSKDISAYLLDAGDSERKSRTILEHFAKLEQYLLRHIPDESYLCGYHASN